MSKDEGKKPTSGQLPQLDSQVDPPDADAFGDEHLPNMPETVTLPDAQDMLAALEGNQRQLSPPNEEGSVTPHDDLPQDALSVRSDLEDTRKEIQGLKGRLEDEIAERERLSKIVSGFQIDVTALATQLQSLTLQAKRAAALSEAKATDGAATPKPSDSGDPSANSLSEVLQQITKSREASIGGVTDAQLAGIIRTNQSASAAASPTIKRRN